MPFQRVSIASAVALALMGPMLPASAQDYDRPPSSLGEDQGGGFDNGGRDNGGYDRGYERGSPDQGAADAGGVAVRVGKLESRIREMTGQIEELQNANRKLVEQLQKFQQDVDSRLTSGGGRSRRSEATPSSASPNAAPNAPQSDAAGSTASADGPAGKAGRKGRGDAFDPDSAPSGAAGRPKPLGSTASAEESNAPMDLSGGKLRRGDSNSDTIAPTLRLPSTTTKPSGGTTTSNGTVVANNAPASPRAEFDLALGRYKDKQYEDAEKGFTAFIQKNPKSRLAADATYYLGESFQQRGRSREAAEQYLKVSTDFASSSRAPDAMLHLGMSLKSLGAKEQACATFSEIGRKYPNAPAYVKSGAEREAKRSQC